LSALAARIPTREQLGSWLTLRRLPVLVVGALVLFAVLYVVVIT
jgi:hypothetical protein